MSSIDNTTARMKDPAHQMGFLADALMGGTSAPIERMERDGQRQLVSSDRLPTDVRVASLVMATGSSAARPARIVRPLSDERWYSDVRRCTTMRVASRNGASARGRSIHVARNYAAGLVREAFEALGFTFGEPDPDDPMFMPATLPPGWKREGSDHAMWSYLVDTAGRQRVGIFYKAAFYDRSAHMHLIGLDWYVTCHVEYDGPLVVTDEWATREAVAAALERGRAECLERAAEFRGYATGDDRHRDAANREGCARHAAEYEATAEKYAAKLAELQARQ